MKTMRGFFSLNVKYIHEISFLRLKIKFSFKKKIVRKNNVIKRSRYVCYTIIYKTNNDNEKYDFDISLRAV